MKSTLDVLLQVNKRTGEIKTCGKPYYKGCSLEDVYTSFSRAKWEAYHYCKKLLYELAQENGGDVLSYGITSKNGFVFTFAGEFTDKSGTTYVLWCTKSYDRIYLKEA